jgi:serine kinase of HPr protein (carbohydrate metabolism regulator)
MTMAPRPLSTEIVHATSVAMDGRAVLLSGASGAGKSDLAVRLIDRGFELVSDDRTIVRRDGERILASPPDAIAGKIEIRGIGIIELPYVSDVPVGLFVELTSDLQRMPDEDRERMLLGIGVPMIWIDAMTASAAAKVALCLQRRPK